MDLAASYFSHNLIFKTPGGTSRGVLKTKPSWIVRVEDEIGKYGYGECSTIPKLSYDDKPGLEQKLNEVCANINFYAENGTKDLVEWPAIRFAIETALLDYHNPTPYTLFSSEFTDNNKGIPINGLIWMGDFSFMKKQIAEKLAEGFSCIKLKIGAINFEEEIKLLQAIRNQYTAAEIEIRVDANGAFLPADAKEKLTRLSALDIHSIEQPIKAGQLREMTKLCKTSLLPIALDEELIGVFSKEEKQQLLKSIQPQYIILKPSLLGGFQATEEWIEAAETNNIAWWATSALESNIGLNAIAQWVFVKNNPLPQGLGTGKLFTNNFNSPLTINNGSLFYDTKIPWDKIK